MRIVQVHAPRFMFEGVTHEIGVKRFKTFAEFDEHIKYREKREIMFVLFSVFPILMLWVIKLKTIQLYVELRLVKVMRLIIT